MNGGDGERRTWLGTARLREHDPIDCPSPGGVRIFISRVHRQRRIPFAVLRHAVMCRCSCRGAHALLRVWESCASFSVPV
eukprot:4135796-Pyramimonas_sp.AAC.1